MSEIVTNSQGNSKLKIVLIAIVFAIVAGFVLINNYIKNSIEKQRAFSDEAAKIAVEVGEEFFKKDSLENYEKTKEAVAFGVKTPYDLCLAARHMESIYNNTNNTSEKLKWKNIREADCTPPKDRK